MPLVFEKQIDAAKKLAVWEITETLDFFLEYLSMPGVKGSHVNRKLEQAASMLLLNYLSGEKLHTKLYRDQFGKPFILNSEMTLSFSHSKNYIACLLDGGGGPTGIDIEYRRANILNLSQKFISELDRCPFDKELSAHVIWGGKEVLYKIYGRKEIDFKKDLSVNFSSNLIGHIHKNNFQCSHKLDFTTINNFILVWNCEILSKNA